MGALSDSTPGGRVLVVNAGSSSVKLRVLDADEQVVHSADLSSVAGVYAEDEVRAVVEQLGPVDAVGHRVVHGGSIYRSPVVITSEVLERLAELQPLAPLHQPAAIGGIRLFSEVYGEVPHVACFDTAFHTTLPPAATTYPIPQEWREKYGVRRFGFHGLSHAYASTRAAEMLHRDVRELRIVTCHLGAGASLAAIDGGRCVDTTMGFTPLEGVVMATRSGSVDPGLVLWLQRAAGLSAEEVADGLERRSGLQALAGTSHMRDILQRAADGDESARLALDVYHHRLRHGVAAMASSLGGIDVLVFTGGIGENAVEVRRRLVEELHFLGVAMDESANAGVRGVDADVTAMSAQAHTVVIHAREDLQIARETRRLVGERA